MNIPVLSIVIPVFNEEAHLEELVARCTAACGQLNRSYELILVDDGSRDRSASIIREQCSQHDGSVVGVLLNRNYGQHAAVMAGLHEARGQIMITLDADLQNPPEEIPRLVAEMDKGCDVVGTIRKNRRDSFFRRLSSRLVNRAIQHSTGVMMHDYGCMLRAYSRSVVDSMLLCHERSTFIPVLANTFASQTSEIEVEHAARQHDDSKYSLWKLIDLQFDLLTSMTTLPLRLLSVLGGAVAVLGFLLSFILLALRIFYGATWAAEGVITVLAVLFIFIGVQLLAIGIVGEYIGRIYEDVRARPRYQVRELIQFSQISVSEQDLESASASGKKIREVT